MYAIVYGGQLVGTHNGVSFMHQDGSTTLNVNVISREERVRIGLFDLIQDHTSPPTDKKQVDLTYTVDVEAGTVTEAKVYGDMTSDEIRDATNRRIDNQIAGLESPQMLPRVTREFMRGAYLAQAAGMGVNEAALRDPNGAHYSPGYSRLADFDDSLIALRAQRL